MLLLRFVASQRQSTVAVLDAADMGTEPIVTFLNHLEQERHNTASTRNVRLSAIHAFFRYVMLSSTLLDEAQEMQPEVLSELRLLSSTQLDSRADWSTSSAPSVERRPMLSFSTRSTRRQTVLPIRSVASNG